MEIIKQLHQLNYRDRIYLILVSFIWLIDYFATFWRRLGADADVANFVFLVVLSLLCIRKWYKSVHFFDILLYFLLVFLYFITAEIYPKTSFDIWSNAFGVTCATFIFFFVGLAFKSKEYSYWLSHLSRFAVILNLVYTIMLSNEGETDDESMHKAYILLPSVLYLLWQFFEYHKIIDFIFFTLGFFLECSMGSRGPFVCIAFYASCYFFFFKHYKHPRIFRTIIVLISILVYLISDYIALLMILLLSKFGMSTRIFDKMLEDSLINYENASGRDELHSRLFSFLQSDTQGIGYGLFSDRMVNDGFYSHNIFVELWFSFGYYIGSIIVIIFLLLVFSFAIKSRDNEYKLFALILFTASFVKLNFSGTFLFDENLYFLIGYCITGLRMTNRKMKLCP